VTQTATSPQRKPLLDEASFQQLLAAAFVLQEHNDGLRAKEFHEDFAKNLSAIVETQKLIQTLQLDLPAAADMVAERVQKITHASGAAIGIIEKGRLFYHAGTGSAAIDAGTRVAPDSALSADCLSRGCVQNYPDVTAESHARADLFRQREVRAFVAVPVYHGGQVAGVLELRFARAKAFREADLRTAELMAGLLSEAMVTAARMKWKQALASERQSMLDALERIKPQLERLGTESPTIDQVVAAEPAAIPAKTPAKSDAFATRNADSCSVCGSDFVDETESFCGICGTARSLASPHSDVPSKINFPWLVPYGQENPSNGNPRLDRVPEENAEAIAEKLPPSLQELIELCATKMESPAGFERDDRPRSDLRFIQAAVTPHAVEAGPAARAQHDSIPVPEAGLASRSEANLPAESEAASTADALRISPADLTPPSGNLQPYPWSSATRAHRWLETVKAQQRPRAEWLAQQWQSRRANVYLVIAALILLVIVSGWGIRPAATRAAGNMPSALNRRHQAPEPQLTAFEKLLVSLGLAEPPPAPSDTGNPETQVWVDVHTALYHCPGSGLYGKTADGRFTTQRDAQQDQFEPANRRVCP
jgi:GAF domain-containing protein